MLRSVKVLMLAGSVGIGLLAANAPARADIIPTLNALPSAVSGGFLWQYDAQLTQQQFLKSGDFFTIFDFNGYVPGSATAPINWVFSSANIGVLPAGLTIPDNASIRNLTWQYTGPTTGNGPTDLGLFTAKSIFSDLGTGMYGAQGHKWSKIGTYVLPDHGSLTMNKGPITTPAPVVPEPCSMALLGLGAAPLLRLRRRNRKA
jgi:hypothetical protein